MVLNRREMNIPSRVKIIRWRALTIWAALLVTWSLLRGAAQPLLNSVQFAEFVFPALMFSVPGLVAGRFARRGCVLQSIRLGVFSGIVVASSRHAAL